MIDQRSKRETGSGAAILSEGLRNSDCEMAIIGAGPYGLAAAAHLTHAQVKILPFGETMGFWRHNMPKGMVLRSPQSGNHIADPLRRLSLDHYAAECGLRLPDPLPLDEFVHYGEWFQRRAAPNLDRREVVRVDQAANGFRLLLSDGDQLRARRILLATGLAHQEFRPPEFRDVPPDRMTHSSDRQNFDALRGRRVAVIGRGQTACEFAVLLHESGAQVELISRGEVRWTGSAQRGHRKAGGVRDVLRRHLRPASPIGPFPVNWLIQAPDAYRRLPRWLQQRVTALSLRPTASAWLHARSEGIRMTMNRRVTGVRFGGRDLVLQLDDGSQTQADHILLATGYRIDIGRHSILSRGVISRILQVDGSPVLSAGFESSVPGLHFAGSSAVHSFGPLMRSIWGAGHAARSITSVTVARR